MFLGFIKAATEYTKKMPKREKVELV